LITCQDAGHVSEAPRYQGASKSLSRIGYIKLVLCLINNAGISIRHPFMDISLQEWRQVMDINLNGAFFVAQQAARRM